MSKKTVTIRGRTYDLDDISDLKSIQTVLVPDNWTTAHAADGVRLFLSLQNMLAMQLKRHLAANFKTLVKTAIEEGEDGAKQAVSVSYNFTIDVTAPTVATISANKLGFSARHETVGKAMTYDLNQGEFLDEDMAVILDVKGFEKENAEPPDNQVPFVAGQDKEGDVTPESSPSPDTPPPAKKRGRPKKK